MGGSFLLNGRTYTYWDEGGSARFSVASNLENTRLDTTYKIDGAGSWDARRLALSDLRGSVTYQHLGLVTGPAGTPTPKGYFRRTLPHLAPETTWLYCTSASYRGHVARDNVTEPTLPGHAAVLIDAAYEGVLYNLRADSEMARVSDGNAWPVDESWFADGEFKRFVSMPTPKDKTRVEWGKGGTWRWDGTSRIAVIGKPIIYKNLEYVITWHNVPVANIPWDSIGVLQGRSNEARFATFPAATLVFDVPGFSGHRDIDGKRICDVHYTFTYWPRGANYFPDPLRGFRFFPLIAADGSGNVPYPVGNFRWLFRPEPAISD